MSTRREKITFVYEETKHLNSDILLKFGQYAVQEAPETVREHPDGCRINLNMMNDAVLQKIYTFVRNQVDRPS